MLQDCFVTINNIFSKKHEVENICLLSFICKHYEIKNKGFCKN